MFSFYVLDRWLNNNWVVHRIWVINIRNSEFELAIISVLIIVIFVVIVVFIIVVTVSGIIAVSPGIIIIRRF